MKKKSIFLIITFLLFFSEADSQEFDLAVQGGLNFAGMPGDNEAAITKTIINFHVGMTMEVSLSDTFSLQPGLIFSKQGGKNIYSEVLEEGEVINAETVVKLDYLNVPVMAKYYIVENFYAIGGPYIGFLISASYKEKVEQTYELKVDISEDIKIIDTVFNLGLGYKFDFGGYIQKSYMLGIRDIYTNSAFKSKNSVCQVSIGYFF